MNIPKGYRPRADLLAGRVILVTGAGQGLGRAVALALAVWALAAGYATVTLAAGLWLMTRHEDRLTEQV